MPWYAYVLMALGASIAIPYLAWVGVSIVRLTRDFVALQRDFIALEKLFHQQVHTSDVRDADRMDWIHGMDSKLDAVCSAVARIEGVLTGKARGVTG